MLILSKEKSGSNEDFSANDGKGINDGGVPYGYRNLRDMDSFSNLINAMADIINIL